MDKRMRELSKIVRRTKKDKGKDKGKKILLKF